MGMVAHSWNPWIAEAKARKAISNSLDCKVSSRTAWTTKIWQNKTKQNKEEGTEGREGRREGGRKEGRKEGREEGRADKIT